MKYKSELSTGKRLEKQIHNNANLATGALAATLAPFKHLARLALAKLVVAALSCAAGAQDYTILSEKGISSANLTELFRIIQDSEYDIGWKPSVGAYQSPNRKQNLRFTYHANGFTAQRRAPIDAFDDWTITLALEAIGKNEAVSHALPPRVELAKQFARFTTDDLVYEYNNSAAGLRQRFIIDKPPRNGNLSLELRLRLMVFKWFWTQREVGLISCGMLTAAKSCGIRT